jgi:hypothetical protein
VAALLTLLTLPAAPPAAAQPPLVVVPAGVVDGQVRLVVEAPDGAGPIRPDAVAVSVDGAPVRATAQPVLSDRLALGLVVDASADGGPQLPVGLGGAANLVLTVPSSTRSTLVTDSTPPAIAVPWPATQPVVLRGLSTVRPDGARSTAAALDLAVAQLPAGGTDPRVVVLYTGGPDVGGEPPAVLADRMRAAGVLLAVVCRAPAAPGDEADFWAAAAAGTGGLSVDAGPAEVIAAFDRVASALARRYVVTVPEPARLPATVAVRMATSAGMLTGEVAVAPPPPAASGPGSGLGGRGAVVAGVVVVAVLAATVVGAVVRRRRRRTGAAPTSADAPSTAPGRTWDVPPPLDGAVDRPGVVAELETALRDGRPVWLRPDPDRAGLGLTTVAAELAHRRRDRYDVAWWIPALDPDLVADRLAELAEALGLAGPADPADRAAATLVEALRHRDRWLLVFDDADGPRQLAGYLPDGPGDVLVCSSDPGWHELAGPVTVPAFTRPESVSLLHARCPDLAAGAADGIAAALGDLPLSVGPAAAFLGDTGMSAGAFRALLADDPDAGDPDPDDPDPLWTAMLDRTAADDPQALALLTLVAWLGPAPVPLSVLTGSSDVLPEPLGTAARIPTGLRHHATLLQRRGLARVSGDEVALHPVPAGLLVGRTRDDHPGEGGWTAVAVRLLRAAAPGGPATDPSTWPAWRRLLPHVLAATDPARRLDPVATEAGWLLQHAGEYLELRGRTHAARALLDDARGLDPGAGRPGPPG